jgi:hypothetical protein
VQLVIFNYTFNTSCVCQIFDVIGCKVLGWELNQALIIVTVGGLFYIIFHSNHRWLICMKMLGLFFGPD